MPNICIQKAYVQGCDCEYMTLKSAANMFECMEIAESIYECVVEPSYKKSNRADANHAGFRRKKVKRSCIVKY